MERVLGALAWVVVVLLTALLTTYLVLSTPTRRLGCQVPSASPLLAPDGPSWEGRDSMHVDRELLAEARDRLERLVQARLQQQVNSAGRLR